MAQKTLTFDFNPELFNPLYWHLKEAHHNEDIRYIWLMGGSSASKTYSEVQLTIIEMMEAPDYNVLVMRKYGTDIKDSIYSDFKAILQDWEISQYFTLQFGYIRCNLTGSYVRFRGLDDSEKVKGISGFKKVILEEISQFDEVDFKQIKKRLRGQAGQQIIGIFNPISEEHWIKLHVFDVDIWVDQPTNIYGKRMNQRGNSLILHTNYLDNKYIVGPQFVDKHVIDDFEQDKITDNAYYNVYGLGNWGKLRTGGEFWKDFSPNKHIKKHVWDEDNALHISWDENVNPYLTCLIFQVKGAEIRQIDEICLEDPRNRVRHVCAEFKKRYPVERVESLFIYGDRTSVKEDTKKEKGENFFTDIQNLLPEYHPKLRLQTVNPSVAKSGDFVNQIFAGRIESMSFSIDPRCKKSLYDYTYALEDGEGGLAIVHKRHPLTKVQYEEYGHCSAALRYYITVRFANEYGKYKTGGKSHVPKTGKPVSKSTY